MLQKFFKYIFQSMAGMLGISVYILADTYFILGLLRCRWSGGLKSDFTGLRTDLCDWRHDRDRIGDPLCHRPCAGQKRQLLFSLRRNSGIFSSAFPLVLAGIFIPDKILQLLGADAGLTALGKQYLHIILTASPFFMSNYAFTAFARNDSAPAIAMLGSIAGSMFNIVFDYIFMFPAGLGLTGAALATSILPASDDDHLQHALSAGKTQSGRIPFPRSIPAPP
ncbi:MAG: MATE family efflux transporter [Clostridium fessum]